LAHPNILKCERDHDTFFENMSLFLPKSQDLQWRHPAVPFSDCNTPLLSLQAVPRILPAIASWLTIGRMTQSRCVPVNGSSSLSASHVPLVQWRNVITYGVVRAIWYCCQGRCYYIFWTCLLFSEQRKEQIYLFSYFVQTLRELFALEFCTFLVAFHQSVPPP